MASTTVTSRQFLTCQGSRRFCKDKVLANTHLVLLLLPGAVDGDVAADSPMIQADEW